MPNSLFIKWARLNSNQLLGHASIAITARHYALLLDEHLEKAVGMLPRGIIYLTPIAESVGYE